MQILEHGSKAPIITCDCGCKYIYGYSDMVEVRVGEDTQYAVYCPECGVETILTEEQVSYFDR